MKLSRRVVGVSVAVLLVVPPVMYVLNPFGTATSDPRGRILGYETYRIPSQSMAPTLKPGDFIMASTMAYMWSKPKANDVIVFAVPGNPRVDFVKRVVATGGQTIRIHDGMLYVDGLQVKEPYLSASTNRRLYSTELPEMSVPRSTLFVLGDNRDNSRDSRFFGAVPLTNVIGKAGFIWFSRDPKRIGTVIK